MRCAVETGDVVGLLHAGLDAHTLGQSSIEHLLHQCGIATAVAPPEVCETLDRPVDERNLRLLKAWVLGRRITVLGFSYRLDPAAAEQNVHELLARLDQGHLLASVRGPVRGIFFAGLPEACDRIRRAFPGISGTFQGDETPQESLAILGIPQHRLPASMAKGVAYDEARLAFGAELIARGDHLGLGPVVRNYAGMGTRGDTLTARVDHGQAAGLPPLLRAHVGPYLPDRREAVALFLEWTRRLAGSGLLDVLSIGTSQLSQEAFGEDWGERPNGGGVPLNTPEELSHVWQAARPMLVRTYAGTRDLVRMARLHEETLDIAWHALSLWWFSQLDGRGPNPVLENLEEHLQTLRVIAASGKPFEPNVPHHFAFRGCDDIGYLVSGYLAARTAKQAGIRTLVLQTMLNTPKSTWGIQDLAKVQALLRLVRGLEGPGFRVLLQPRAGLDAFSPDEQKARIQLAAITAMMDDIEPEDANSPQIIHVVSHSEAIRLADPPVIEESLRITRQALGDYRRQRKKGLVPDMARDPEVSARSRFLEAEARILLQSITSAFPDPCSARSLYGILEAGYLPVPHLWACRDLFPAATRWQTRNLDGGVCVVDPQGKPIPARERVLAIEERMRHGH